MHDTDLIIIFYATWQGLKLKQGSDNHDAFLAEKSAMLHFLMLATGEQSLIAWANLAF